MIEFQIAILESQPNRLELMINAIKNIFQVSAFQKGKEFLEAVDTTTFDLALIDFNVDDINAPELQETLQQSHPDLTIVLLSSFDRSKTAVQSVRRRAMDYLYRSDDPERFSHDVCKLVRAIIDEQKRKKLESLLEETDLYPAVKKLYSERNVDVEELKKAIAQYKKQ